MANAQRKPLAPRNALERAFAARFGHRIGPDVKEWDRVTTKKYAPWTVSLDTVAECHQLAAFCGITVEECWERQARAFETMTDQHAVKLYRKATLNGGS